MLNKTKLLDNFLSKINAKYKIISTKHIIDLKNEIKLLYEFNKISKKIYNYVSKYYQFNSNQDVKSKYIIIISIPQKITTVTFQIKGKKIDIIIPPTYIYTEKQKNIYHNLVNIFKNSSFIELAYLPKKLLAARSGLAKYGKNNLCYVDGMGSFHRLESFYIKYPFDIYNWKEKIVMNECKKCSLCKKVCPNHCIKNKKFVIKAEHCLTFFNENIDKFPNWIDNRSHNALVGCMKCQIVCPVNRDYIKKREKRITFSEDESDIFIKGLNKNQLTTNLLEKLKTIDMDEYISVLSRNINYLIK